MKLNQRVKLDRSFESDKHKDAADITGTIVGLGHRVTTNQTKPVYMVELDQGFYDPTQRIYVSVLVVARDNLLPIGEVLEPIATR